jgi:hypothetical protein
MNNLQLIPSDIGTRTDIYKSFSAEQAPDAIGGVIDIISRSAFDRSGKYVFADVAGIYSAETNVERSAGGNHETLGHFGKSAKMVFSNQFGVDQEVRHRCGGTLRAAFAQQRQALGGVELLLQRRWQYLTDGTTGRTRPRAGTGCVRLATSALAPIPTSSPTSVAPPSLSGKPSDDPFYASLLLYSYRFYENSTMNKTDLYGNAKFPSATRPKTAAPPRSTASTSRTATTAGTAATVAPSPASTGTSVIARG